MFKLRQRYMAEAGEGGEGTAPVADVPKVDSTPKVEPTKAPVTPAQEPAPAKEPVQESTKEPAKVSYTSSAAKQVSDMITEAGLDSAQARDAINANGGVCTPEIYKALVEKHGEGMASLLSAQMTQVYTEQVDAGTAQDKAIYSQVEDAFKGVTEQSGEETWSELSAWAKTNVSNDDRKELNAVIAQGGMAAKLAVQELVNMFQQSGDYSQEMVGLEGDNVPNAGKGGDLTRQEYNTELDALLAKGQDYSTSREVKALQARRARSASRNI
ncbi:MAG: hypothetical protein V7745_07070 [Pseudomonadales bacterium]|tara:strand:+ start:4880 stop:5689 length:810 start_codon:yes stop_codon:yes gene_type:complete